MNAMAQMRIQRLRSVINFGCASGKAGGRSLSPESVKSLGSANVCAIKKKDGTTVYYKRPEAAKREHEEKHATLVKKLKGATPQATEKILVRAEKLAGKIRNSPQSYDLAKKLLGAAAPKAVAPKAGIEEGKKEVESSFATVKIPKELSFWERAKALVLPIPSTKPTPEPTGKLKEKIKARAKKIIQWIKVKRQAQKAKAEAQKAKAEAQKAKAEAQKAKAEAPKTKKRRVKLSVRLKNILHQTKFGRAVKKLGPLAGPIITIVAKLLGG